MKKVNQVPPDGDISFAIASSGLLGSDDKSESLGPEGLTAVQAEVMRLFLERLRKEREAEEQRLEQQRRARESGARAREEAARAERAVQDSCPHMKPWGGPSIAGQRDHQHNVHFICLYCGKTWVNNELPAHLRIPSEEVGGPVS